MSETNTTTTTTPTGGFSAGMLSNLWYRYGSKCAACGKHHRQGSLVWYIKGESRGKKVHCPKEECVPASHRESFSRAVEARGGTGTAGEISGEMASEVADKLAPKVEAIVKREVNANKVRKLVHELVDGLAPRRIQIQMPTGETHEFTREHKLFEKLYRLLALGENVWLGGPAGSGKTTAAKRIAASLGYKVFVVGPTSDEFQLLGFRDANGNYQETEFYRWATCEEPCLLIIDEVDRFHPRAVVAMNMALANWEAVFPTGRVEIDPETHKVVATGNTFGGGAGASAYVAAAKQDGAFVDRFPAMLDWDYDTDLERHLVALKGGCINTFEKALKIRGNLKAYGIDLIWGPRATVALSVRVAAGFTMKEAIEVSALVKLDATQFANATKGVL